MLGPKALGHLIELVAWLAIDGHACLKAMCFTGFETGVCLYLWWQIKESAFHYMHNTRRCHCYRWNPYIFCILLRHTDALDCFTSHVAEPVGVWNRLTDAQRSKPKQGNWQKLSIFRPLTNISRTFWFPAWSREELCTNQTRCWLFHGLKATMRIFFFQSLPSTSLPLKQTQWCGHLPTGLQSMTV